MPDLYDTNEAARVLGIGYATLYRWIKAGKLIPVRVDKRTLIPKSEIDRLQQNSKEVTTNE
ncbi:hypothetical protein ES705_32855 [subsurface metagenome]